MPFRVGTDCSGIEAPIIALQNLNISFDHEFSCDCDIHVQNTIKANFKPKILYDNIFNRDISNIPDIDLYIAGFPCQPFSTINQHREGFNEINKKGIIFFECLKILQYKNPNYFIFENVIGLLTHNKKKTFGVIQAELNKLPYTVSYLIFNPTDFNIPQDRRRLYMIGIHNSLNKSVNFTTNISLNRTIRDFFDDTTIGNKHALLRPKKLKILEDKIIEKKINETDDWIINLNTSGGPFATAKKDICPCIITTSFMYYITSLQRFLTINELMKLQGFPSDFKIVVPKIQAFKQCGNSMCIPILEFIFKQILL
tara:strand:+ start:11431 stop:12366 length:936 start_codon:yes stop_codon:yes gene_type:complete